MLRSNVSRLVVWAHTECVCVCVNVEAVPTDVARNGNRDMRITWSRSTRAAVLRFIVLYAMRPLSHVNCDLPPSLLQFNFAFLFSRPSSLGRRPFISPKSMNPSSFFHDDDDDHKYIALHGPDSGAHTKKRYCNRFICAFEPSGFGWMPNCFRAVFFSFAGEQFVCVLPLFAVFQLVSVEWKLHGPKRTQE